MKPTFTTTQVDSNRIIYTPSRFAVDNLLQLQEVGRLTALSQHSSHRQGLDSYLFFIVENGSGTLTVRGNTYQLAPGACAFVDCHDSYTHATSPDLWTLKWIHFTSPGMPAIYQEYMSNGGSPVFTPADPNGLIATWQHVYDYASADDSSTRDLYINQTLWQLLTQLMICARPAQSSDLPHGSAAIQQIKSYLDANFAKKITLDELSQRYFLNKYYITRLFKETYQTSVISYVTALRITAAKRAIRFTDLPLEQIAADCGFESPYYFSKCFKKVEGISPRDYRRHWVQ